MLNRIAFVSALTEGLTTVIPLQEDEIVSSFEIVTDYLEENFPGFSTELIEGEENYEIKVNQGIDFAYTIQFVDNKIFILNDDNFSPSTELAGSLYGILMIMSTYLIVRLNSFSFTSQEVSPDVYHASAYITEDEVTDFPKLDTKINLDKETEDTRGFDKKEDKEEDSDFDDEWI